MKKFRQRISLLVLSALFLNIFIFTAHFTSTTHVISSNSALHHHSHHTALPAQKTAKAGFHQTFFHTENHPGSCVFFNLFNLPQLFQVYYSLIYTNISNLLHNIFLSYSWTRLKNILFFAPKQSPPPLQ